MTGSGTACAAWTGIAIVGAVILGVVMLGESASPMRFSAIAIIVAGVVVLKLAES
ncbi:SMR family transporter [Parvibaculum sp.]|uniref:SMR family transporter n=1 Tax=Parvibaculum sp. TaxID=2024848 RepID=UPI0025D4F2EB|nr:SMR family transporter [Parvibaculum sp.]